MAGREVGVPKFALLVPNFLSFHPSQRGGTFVVLSVNIYYVPSFFLSCSQVKVDSKNKTGTIYPSIRILTRTDGRDPRTVDTRDQKELLLQGLSA